MLKKESNERKVNLCGTCSVTRVCNLDSKKSSAFFPFIALLLLCSMSKNKKDLIAVGPR